VRALTLIKLALRLCKVSYAPDANLEKPRIRGAWGVLR